MKTFFTFLQILQPELERFGGEESGTGSSDRPLNGLDKITVVARRVLPALRQYSSWMVSNTAFLVAQVGDTSRTVQIKELWKVYANTLTLLAATFPVSELPEIGYLLEEDVDTLGFKPFTSDRSWRRYFVNQRGETQDRKPKWNDRGVERHHPNVEMLGRVRDFLVDGLTLATDDVRTTLRAVDIQLTCPQTVPISLIPGTTQFAYQEEGVPSELLASPSGHQATLSSTSIEREDIPAINGHANKSAVPDAASNIDDQASQSASMNTAMNHMVDKIVGSEADDCTNCRDTSVYPDEAIPPTPPAHTFDDDDDDNVAAAANPDSNPFDFDSANETTYGLISTLTAQDLITKVYPDLSNSPYSQPSPTHSTHRTTPRPVLPSVLNSAFAPQPGEVSPQTRPTTASRISPTPNGNGHSQFRLHSVHSSCSSMLQPSSLAWPYSPRADGFGKADGFGPGGYAAPVGAGRARFSTGYGLGRMADEGTLMFSPAVFDGSQWRGSGSGSGDGFGMRAQQTQTHTHTPPNGQGG